MGHIIFCCRIKGKGISYGNYSRRITKFLQKSSFMYHLIETQNEVMQFLDEYADNMLYREGHFSWKVFLVPQKACKTFLPEEIIKKWCASCRCINVVERFWSY